MWMLLQRSYHFVTNNSNYERMEESIIEQSVIYLKFILAKIESEYDLLII